MVIGLWLLEERDNKTKGDRQAAPEDPPPSNLGFSPASGHFLFSDC